MRPPRRPVAQASPRRWRIGGDYLLRWRRRQPKESSLDRLSGLHALRARHVPLAPVRHGNGELHARRHPGGNRHLHRARRGRGRPGNPFNPSPRIWSERRPRAGAAQQLLGIEHGQAGAARRLRGSGVETTPRRWRVSAQSRSQVKNQRKSLGRRDELPTGRLVLAGLGVCDLCRNEVSR